MMDMANTFFIGAENATLNSWTQQCICTYFLVALLQCIHALDEQNHPYGFWMSKTIHPVHGRAYAISFLNNVLYFKCLFHACTHVYATV